MTCVHHWEVPPPTPRSRVLPSRCRKCGATRDFLLRPKTRRPPFLTPRWLERQLQADDR